jgi:hypothetical protein
VSTALSLGPLPGEDLSVTYTRVLDACMDGYSAPFTLTESIDNGVRETARSYDIEIAVNKEHLDECSAKALQAAPLPVLSEADYVKAWESTRELIECLSSAGFDMGTLISLEALKNPVASQLSSKWDSAQRQPGFPEQFNRCSSASRPK